MENKTELYDNFVPGNTSTELYRRPNRKLIKTLDDGENIVTMIEHNGNLYMATNRSVYIMLEDKFVEMAIEEIEDLEKE